MQRSALCRFGREEPGPHSLLQNIVFDKADNERASHVRLVFSKKNVDPVEIEVALVEVWVQKKIVSSDTKKTIEGLH